MGSQPLGLLRVVFANWLLCLEAVRLGSGFPSARYHVCVYEDVCTCIKIEILKRWV